MVEGTPLLRVQMGNCLEGSNPFLSATFPFKLLLPFCFLRHDTGFAFPHALAPSGAATACVKSHGRPLEAGRAWDIAWRTDAFGPEIPK